MGIFAYDEKPKTRINLRIGVEKTVKFIHDKIQEPFLKFGCSHTDKQLDVNRFMIGPFTLAFKDNKFQVV